MTVFEPTRLFSPSPNLTQKATRTSGHGPWLRSSALAFSNKAPLVYPTRVSLPNPDLAMLH